MIDFIVNKEKCIKCGQCVKECPSEIIFMEKDYPFIPKDKEAFCIKCQHCLAVCPTGAVSILGFDPENSVEFNAGFPEPKKMELLLKGRRSTRQFKKENIDKQEIVKLINTVSHAPTGCNTMSVCFTVIDEYRKLELFRDLVMEKLRVIVKGMKLPSRFRFFEEILNRWDSDRTDRLFWNAPHMIVASCPEGCVSPLDDCLIALSEFELMANCQGIGTLWNGLIKCLIAIFAPELKKVLSIPEDHVIGGVILFGKPAVRFYRTVQRMPKVINFSKIQEPV